MGRDLFWLAVGYVVGAIMLGLLFAIRRKRRNA